MCAQNISFVVCIIGQTNLCKQIAYGTMTYMFFFVFFSDEFSVLLLSILVNKHQGHLRSPEFEL